MIDQTDHRQMEQFALLKLYSLVARLTIGLTHLKAIMIEALKKKVTLSLELKGLMVIKLSKT